MASRFIPNRCVIRRMRVYTGVTRGKRLVVLVGQKAHRHCRAQRVRFETKWLSQPENLAYARRSGRPVGRRGAPAATAEGHRARNGLSESPTYGEQEGSAYNGHF